MGAILVFRLVVHCRLSLVLIVIATLRWVALEHMGQLVVEWVVPLSVWVAVAAVECVVVLRLETARLSQLIRVSLLTQTSWGDLSILLIRYLTIWCLRVVCLLVVTLIHWLLLMDLLLCEWTLRYCLRQLELLVKDLRSVMGLDMVWCELVWIQLFKHSLWSHYLLRVSRWVLLIKGRLCVNQRLKNHLSTWTLESTSWSAEIMKTSTVCASWCEPCGITVWSLLLRELLRLRLRVKGWDWGFLYQRRLDIYYTRQVFIFLIVLARGF